MRPKNRNRLPGDRPTRGKRQSQRLEERDREGKGTDYPEAKSWGYEGRAENEHHYLTNHLQETPTTSAQISVASLK